MTTTPLQPPTALPHRRPRARALLVAAAVLVPGVLLAVLLRPETGIDGPNNYVGRAVCARCHQPQMNAYAGSQHDLAMQEPTPVTVLGDFTGSTFTHSGVTTTFHRDGDRFVVDTDGPDGQLRDYMVQFVFGVYPLQQYLLDIGSGRLQALGIAWDCRPKEDGGQRWFHLYPQETLHAGDELHWTGLQQNWNFMCAECHSTDLRRGYDAERDSYRTSWSELDVSCEACHGPASRHVAWADGERGYAHYGDEPGKGLVVAFDERKAVTWSTDPTPGLPVRSRERTSQKELDTCARCHSRRTVFAEDFVPGKPLLQTHWPALLTEGLYHADGQMQDEVYNYQSFLQSRMSQKGVTCSDCHEPHTGKPRIDGNGLCLQCHDPRFDRKEHHFHQQGSPQARCIACHAPTVTYMGVDPRHDHSFKVPRPDLAQQFGVPDVCSGCHQDQTPAWAVTQLQKWYGRLRTDRSAWTPAFAAARAHRLDAEPQLLQLLRDAEMPDIVRATALRELPLPLSAEAEAMLATAVHAADPLLRWTAADVLSDAAPEQRAPLRALLRDPVRGVRVQACRGLVATPTDGWSDEELQALRDGVAEYKAAQLCNADRPESRVNLGNLAREQGKLADAAAEFRAALRLLPTFVPASVNLADLYRQEKREEECERTLRGALKVTPGNAELLHALGLCLVREKRSAEAVEALGQAAAAAPGEVRYVYVYAAALESVGRVADAVTVLREACSRLVESPELVELLVDYLVQSGDVDGARVKAMEFEKKWPEAAAVQRWRGGLLK